MVLFIYITRLASNEKIKINLKHLSLALIVAALIGVLGSRGANYQIERIINIINQNKIFFNIYSLESFILVALTILYLLLTLIVVVKVSNKFNAPIKNLIFS
jgi:hypothetical protein